MEGWNEWNKVLVIQNVREFVVSAIDYTVIDIEMAEKTN